jgi:hypothetical protein
MKIRNGFVSNSSSSSFCIYGVSIDQEEFAALIDKDFNSDDYDVYEELNKIPAYGANDYERELVWIGEKVTSMEMDETRREFEARVEKEIKSNFKHELNKEFSWMEVEVSD